MTCRPLLWITAAAVSVGAVASTPSIAAAEPAAGWTVTIDEPATEVVDTKQLRIEGTAAVVGLVQPDEVTVTIVPQDPLPQECTPEPGRAPVDRQRYSIVLPVRCNGPHQIQVVARNVALGLGSGEPATRAVGVAEVAEEPPYPQLEETPEGGLKVSWEPTNDLDAAGSVLSINGRRQITFAPGVIEATLPPADRRSGIALARLRWGAGGPDGTVVSPFSTENILGETNPNPPTNPDPPTPEPPTPEPPAVTPPPSTPGPSSTSPPSANGGGIPTRGTGATSTTLPEGYSEELPFGAPDEAFVPGAEPDRRSSSDAEERAVSTAAPVGGLVRTSEKRSPGLVAPFALGLMMITIAAHIAWYLRRSRPTPGGQVRLP